MTVLFGFGIASIAASLISNTIGYTLSRDNYLLAAIILMTISMLVFALEIFYNSIIINAVAITLLLASLVLYIISIYKFNTMRDSLGDKLYPVPFILSIVSAVLVLVAIICMSIDTLPIIKSLMGKSNAQPSEMEFAVTNLPVLSLNNDNNNNLPQMVI
jgi:hypothetical protein